MLCYASMSTILLKGVLRMVLESRRRALACSLVITTREIAAVQLGVINLIIIYSIRGIRSEIALLELNYDPNLLYRI